MKKPKNFTEQKFNKIAGLVEDLMWELGLNINCEGFKETPERIAGFWDEFLGYSDDNLETTFESARVDQMVLLKDIPFYSLCSHHLLPFSGKATVAYIAGDKVLGLSKLARIVQKHAHKPQMQEEMAQDIANELKSLLPDSLGVGVYIKAKHTCMAMRGIKSEGEMVTNVLLGKFLDDLAVRTEFLHFCKD